MKNFMLLGSLALLVTAFYAQAQTQSEEPEEDSNYSVQIGQLNYLGSFYEQFTPPYGIIAGKAALYRMARTGIAHVSVAFGVGLSLELDGPGLEELAATQFHFKLHSRPCSESGGAVYQHPYLCGESGCTQAQVDAARDSKVPLELAFNASVDTNNFNGAAVNVTWPVHIPDFFLGQDRKTLSLVMYSPSHENVPMVCADLQDDREMDGLVYYVNEDANDNVPSVSNALLTREETGVTKVEIRVANLRAGHIYPAYIHSLPCVPLSAESVTRGGERYMRDISCYGRIGSSGCEATEENQLWLRLQVDPQTAAAELNVEFDELLRADAQSIILNDCLDNDGNTDATGTCEGSEPVLVCIDIVNELPTIASSSSTATTQEATTPQPVDKQTFSPTATTSAPSATPTYSPSPVPKGKSGDGGHDDGDSAINRGTTMFPDNQSPPPSQWSGKNPCPKMKAVHAPKKRGGKGKTKKNKLDFVDHVSTDIGQCCLEVTPPASLVGFVLLNSNRGAASSQVTASVIVVGVAGAFLIVAAGAMLAVRRRREYTVHMEALEEASYAVPVADQTPTSIVTRH